jgi:hypothetical protein
MNLSFDPPEESTGNTLELEDPLLFPGADPLAPPSTTNAFTDNAPFQEPCNNPTHESLDSSNCSSHSVGNDDSIDNTHSSDSKKGIRFSSNGITLKRKNIGNEDEDDSTDEDDARRKKDQIENVFKKNSKAYFDYFDLCIRKGWLPGVLPMCKGAQADHDLVAFMESNRFTRAQVCRKFKEFKKFYQHHLNGNEGSHSKAVATVKQALVDESLKTLHHKQTESTKKRKGDKECPPKQGRPRKDSKMPETVTRTRHTKKQLAAARKDSDVTSVPMLPPMHPHEFAGLIASTAGTGRAASPFCIQLQNVKSPIPWGPNFERFNSWAKPTPLQMPALISLPTQEVNNLMQGPLVHNPEAVPMGGPSSCRCRCSSEPPSTLPTLGTSSVPMIGRNGLCISSNIDSFETRQPDAGNGLGYVEQLLSQERSYSSYPVHRAGLRAASTEHAFPSSYTNYWPLAATTQSFRAYTEQQLGLPLPQFDTAVTTKEQCCFPRDLEWEWQQQQQ